MTMMVHEFVIYLYIRLEKVQALIFRQIGGCYSRQAVICFSTFVSHAWGLVIMGPGCKHPWDCNSSI